MQEKIHRRSHKINFLGAIKFVCRRICHVRNRNAKNQTAIIRAKSLGFVQQQSVKIFALSQHAQTHLLFPSVELERFDLWWEWGSAIDMLVIGYAIGTVCVFAHKLYRISGFLCKYYTSIRMPQTNYI